MESILLEIFYFQGNQLFYKTAIRIIGVGVLGAMGLVLSFAAQPFSVFKFSITKH